GLEERDLPLREQPHLGPAQRDRADRLALAHQWDTEVCAEAHASGVLAALGKLIDLRRHVSDVDRATVEHRAARARSADQRERELTDGSPLRDRAMTGDKEKPIAVETEQGRVERIAEPCCTLGDGVEDGLDVCG